MYSRKDTKTKVFLTTHCVHGLIWQEEKYPWCKFFKYKYRSDMQSIKKWNKHGNIFVNTQLIAEIYTISYFYL